MAKHIVKFRLITWFEEVDSPFTPGQTVLAERINHFGEEVDVTNPAQEKRLLDLGAFYTDEEYEQILNGTYAGDDSYALTRARQGIFTGPVEEVEGEGVLDFQTASDEEIADYIQENKLTVPNTLALLPEDATEDDVNKLIDAEGLATNNSPRAGVTDPLEKRLAELAQNPA